MALYLLCSVHVPQIQAMGDTGQPHSEAADTPSPQSAWTPTAGKEVAIPGALLVGDQSLLGLWVLKVWHDLLARNSWAGFRS